MKLSMRWKFSNVHRSVMMLVFVSGLGWLGWISWQWWTNWVDTPLPQERIVARQIRINTTTKQKVLTSITEYQSPAELPSVPKIVLIEEER